MKYQLKSGKVFVRMCDGLINALKNGDALILNGDKCDFSIAIENSCIYTNVIYNERYNKLDSVLKYALLSCNTAFYQDDFNSLKQAKNVLVALTLKAEEKAVEKAKNTDIAHVSDDILTCMLNNEIEYINNELMEVCLYDKMNGGSGCVVLGSNEWIDVTTATQEYINRFGVYNFFEYIESLLYFTTHVVYNCIGNIYTDYLDDCMYIEEVVQYDEHGNIIEYYETENFKIQLQVVKQEKAENAENAENSENTENSENAENTENSEKTENSENAINTDNNISELTKSVIELDKLKKSNNEISEKSREFLKEFNALSKDIITNAVDNAIKNTNKALLRIKINNLMCFTYLLTQAICKFLQNCNKVPNNTNGFIRCMKFNFLGIVFNIQVIDGKITYVNFGRLSMFVNNRCNYIAYDYVLDCYTYFSNIYYNIGRCIINAYRHIHINSYRKVTIQHILLKQFCGSYAENHS